MTNNLEEWIWLLLISCGLKLGWVALGKISPELRSNVCLGQNKQFCSLHSHAIAVLAWNRKFRTVVQYCLGEYIYINIYYQHSNLDVNILWVLIITLLLYLLLIIIMLLSWHVHWVYIYLVSIQCAVVGWLICCNMSKMYITPPTFQFLKWFVQSETSVVTSDWK